ncbi:polymorphic toxin type 50 domain-containing protein [Neisseria lactamica]|uniref:polymorphic toxin type 50 domain-containing protein n=1 Tax=Neisseria lactamica TaxID=486 RepID=UPI0011D19AAB
MNKGFNYSPTLPQHESGNSQGYTRSLLSEGNITIGGKKTSARALGIHTDSATAHHGADSVPDLQNLLDKQQTVARSTAAIHSAVGTYRGNRAKAAAEELEKQQAAHEGRLKEQNDGSYEQYAGKSDSERLAMRLGNAKYAQAYQEARSWGVGGSKSRALSAAETLITGALGGQGDLQLAANTLAPYAAAAIGKRFGHGENKNEAAQAIGHFMLGAALAYANGADPLAGGSAAVAAERAAEYLAGQYDDGRTAIDPISGKFNPNLLSEHIKEEIKAQTGALASVVGAAGGSLNGTNGGNGALFDAQVAGMVGQNAVENNYLTSTTLDDVKKGKKSKEDALRIYRINKENLERQCATSQSSSLCRAAVNTAKDFVNNQLAKHFFPDEVKTTNQLLEKYSEAAQYKSAPLKINLRMEKSMFTGEGLPEGRTSDYIKGTGKSILAYVWDERGGATGGAQYGMPIGTFAYNQYALENPYQTTKTRQEYLGSVYGPAVLTLTGAKFRIRPTRPITKPTQGKIIPIGESYIPSSPHAVQGTTVTLMQEQRLANGQVIPKGSKVTWSDNAVKVVRPDGSKRVFSSRVLEQNKKTDVPRIEKADVPLIEKLFKTHGVADKVSMQKQKRHILGTAPHDKSYLSSYKDAQTVLDAYKSGTARVISIDLSDNSVLIEVKNVNGVYVNRGNPNGKPDIVKNTNIFKIQSINKSPKVVPVNPNKGK